MKKGLSIGILILGMAAALLVACTTVTTEKSISPTKTTKISHAHVQRGDFWDNLTHSFKLKHYPYREDVLTQINWLKNNQGYLNSILENSSPYLYYISQQIKKRHLPGELALLPIIESDYDPFAYSNRGAAGLWQLMPGTATGYGLKENWWYDERRDICASTDAALDYLTYLQDFFNGNWILAIAAYDSGEGTVQNAVRKNKKRGYKTNFWFLHLPKETKSYVPRLLALAAIISNPSHYGVRLPKIKNGPYFGIVKVSKQLALVKAAKLAGITLKELYTLNPGYNRWETDPNGPYQLLLPTSKVALFKKNISKLSGANHFLKRKHTVRKGDSLYTIAKHYNKTVAKLKSLNKLKTATIYPGQHLVINKKHNVKHVKLPSKIKNATKKQSKLGPTKLKYTIKHGDTVWGLSRHYGVKPVQIRFWNNLKAKHELIAEKKLILWIPRNKKHKHHKITVYKIKAGDSLSRVAHKFHTSVAKLKKNNKIKGDVVKVGQKLILT